MPVQGCTLTFLFIYFAVQVTYFGTDGKSATSSRPTLPKVRRRIRTKREGRDLQERASEGTNKQKTKPSIFKLRYVHAMKAKCSSVQYGTNTVVHVGKPATVKNY